MKPETSAEFYIDDVRVHCEGQDRVECLQSASQFYKRYVQQGGKRVYPAYIVDCAALINPETPTALCSSWLVRYPSYFGLWMVWSEDHWGQEKNKKKDLENSVPRTINVPESGDKNVQ